MRVLVMSDIHGNEQALLSVLEYCLNRDKIDKVIMLGDVIDYGMHSNEVIDRLRTLEWDVVCNIWGNHEEAVMKACYERFSSERGKESARYTSTILTQRSKEYIQNDMTACGSLVFDLAGKKCLAVHGSLEDIYWKSIKPGERGNAYREYDIVFSGHSHLPHMFEVYYEAEVPENRNKKKTIFFNPGSVGQPRNLNSRAQFVVWDTDGGQIEFKSIAYNIQKEQEAYKGQVDDFYRDRLERGI